MAIGCRLAALFGHPAGLICMRTPAPCGVASADCRVLEPVRGGCVLDGVGK
jgi:hypothetical protein